MADRTLTAEDLTTLAALAAAATPGDWEVRLRDAEDPEFRYAEDALIVHAQTGDVIADMAGLARASNTRHGYGHAAARADAAFIVAARAALPALLDALADRDEQIRRLTAQ